MPLGDELRNLRRLLFACLVTFRSSASSAIAYAHARLVVHRDLKPSNIMVDDSGRVHVVDFGLAKLLDETVPGAQVTQTVARTLTPEYASPEQIRGETVTVASDVYSLGVVLYQLLAGKRPYRVRREPQAALEEAIVEADVPAASSQVADRALARALRGDIDTILSKALRKDVNERYGTVEAFAGIGGPWRRRRWSAPRCWRGAEARCARHGWRRSRRGAPESSATGR